MPAPRSFPRGVFLMGACLIAVSAHLHGQGSLTPPGAPAPTMKTLEEVEPRIAVQSLTGDATALHVIRVSGSYYLTDDLTGAAGKSAIAITANAVTLDLGGHVLVGKSDALMGIEIRGARTQIVIRHGTVRAFGTGGVVATASLTHSRLEQLVVSSSGPGIVVQDDAEGTVVRECTVGSANGHGIKLSTTTGAAEHCRVNGCTGDGIAGITASSVTNCEVSNIVGTGSGDIFGINTQNARGCTVRALSSSGGANGIFGPVVQGCVVESVSSTSGTYFYGIQGETVTDCRVSQVGIPAGSTGYPRGIQGQTVTGCSVRNIGNATTTFARGILAQNVQHCDVESVGHASTITNVVGVQSTIVGNTKVNFIYAGGGGFATGISADRVSDCSVSVVKKLGSGSGSATGINGATIGDCWVSEVAVDGTGLAAGIKDYRLARHTVVYQVSGGFDGTGVGAWTEREGRSEALTVKSASTRGIEVEDSHVVIGCTITTAPIGIEVNGQNCVVDGNNLGGAHSTAIRVASGSNTAQALVVRNQIRNATVKVVADSPAQIGPLINATGTIVATNPWANFTD